MAFPPLQIRPMTADDLDGVLALEAASFPDPWSRSLYEHELNDNRLSRYRVVVPVEAEASRKVIGHGGWMLFGEEAHILTIAVRPELRGQGIGRWLLLHLLNEAREASCTGVVLEVRPSNAAALRLYERLGFAVIGRRKRYYPDKENALVLQLEGLDDARLWGLLERELKRLSEQFGQNEIVNGEG